jgi:NADH-quinone oxidoreductase subunit L
MSAGDFFWLAPLVPLAAFALLALRDAGARSAPIAIVAVAAALAISGAALFAAASGERAVAAMPWLATGGRPLTFALMLDPLAAVVAVLVSLVALVVVVYAATYMAEGGRIARFFAFMSLFVGAMLSLVFAADLLSLFIAWELIGICSYLLIGFWFERPEAAPAATQALIVTRVADMALLAGIVLLIEGTGTSRIDSILHAIATGNVDAGRLPVIAALLFVGAAGKAAQVPFHGWLPDAMVGPTPVSALLHSATMVAAGVFLVARLYPLFLAAPPLLTIIAWTGVITALAGGIAALGQTDLKRLLAYSTLSQLGLMFVGLGAGSLLAGVLLLIAQALYKATLFLAAGTFERAVGGREAAKMRGAGRRMPIIGVAFAIAATALAGLPVTFAAPPKDPVIAAALDAGSTLFALTLLASFVTALYAARVSAVLFARTSAADVDDAQSARPGLAVPTLAMGILICVGLLADARIAGHPLAMLLGVAPSGSTLPTILALAASLLGIATGLAGAGRAGWATRLHGQERLRRALDVRRSYHAIAQGTIAISESVAAFDASVFDANVARLTGLLRAAIGRGRAFDTRIFDGVADRAVRHVRRLVRSSERFDRHRLERLVKTLVDGLIAASERLRSVQTGQIGNYLLVLVVGSAALGVAFAVANAR